MHPAFHALSLISLISLSLGSFTGCGEKQIQVATLSGAPSDEIAGLVSIQEEASSDISSSSEGLMDESALSAQASSIADMLKDLDIPVMPLEPINIAHEPRVLLPGENDSSESFLADTIASVLESDVALTDPRSDTKVPTEESGLSRNDGSLDTLGVGQKFRAQSASSPIEDFQELTYSDPMPSPLPQHPSTELDNAFSGELEGGVEPGQEVFHIAKADPSDSLLERLNRIKEEEFAKASGLANVFFQFDSWALTEQGKHSLQRMLWWFEQVPDSDLIIEGHADQRGTQAYNLVLAIKRAFAVKDYLAQLGVNRSRLAIISYGKDKPFCRDSTEVCHQLNRRGHLFVRTP